jgi:hypothetical protein
MLVTDLCTILNELPLVHFDYFLCCQAQRSVQEVSGDMYAGASLLFTIQDRLTNYRQVS